MAVHPLYHAARTGKLLAIQPAGDRIECIPRRGPDADAL